MLITGREAAVLLTEVVPTREHARLLLRAGLSGQGIKTSAAVLYDRDQVQSLAKRQLVDLGELARRCPHGLYIARLARTTPLDVTLGWDQVARQVAQPPAMPPLTQALLAAQVAGLGPLPWVATLFGFVVLCADVTRVGGGADGGMEFTLVKPGAWADAFTSHRLPTRRGGRPWEIRAGPPQAARVSARGGP